ncbi:PepSY domain-containing protein [Psychrobacillus antarcticus]|uniref:PepSY domain-containing protein n=1 Tax=Psychrobacillus antarcticus TaxID=2879115 RepID=UPI0024086CA9|nr:PepSY domain-containing protein [Psychrobacillus antarcticus]
MKINKSGWIIGGIILVILLVIGVLWLSPFSTKTLTEEELKATALAKYPGEIIRAAKSNNDYEIEMQMENGIYTIRMDSKNGDILSLKQLPTEEVSPSVDKLTEGQIKEEIATQGELQSIHFINDADTPYYEAIVLKGNAEFTLKVDPYTGAIIDSTQATLEAPVTTESTLLTEQEALIIAAKHLKGIADEDAELHQPTGQTPYYLVDVEIENDEEEDREAVVQVDAYTGTVKSVIWED